MSMLGSATIAAAHRFVAGQMRLAALEERDVGAGPPMSKVMRLPSPTTRAQ